jgi:hypothetical protein
MRRPAGRLVLPAALLAAAVAAGPVAAEDKTGEKNDPRVGEICDLIAENASAVGMAPDFFARLIWKESRFDESARSPVGAQGIAQFMPYTARERGLANPYDKKEALKHSAMYLRDLRAELGSWGLAAAAYNGGINRVKRWRQAGGRLPYETEDYVLSITAQPASFFQDDKREATVRPLVEGLDFAAACRRLPVLTTRAVFAMAESAPMRPWGAQIAGNANEAIAVRVFHKLQDRYPGVLGDIKPIVMRVRPLSGPRRITAIRVGADSRREANSFCAKYRGAGGDCVVLRN